MTERYAHLVGSLPGASAYEAMSMAMKLLGGRLHSLPDGETGERRNWIISIVESLRSHPDLELAKQGDWSDYDKTPRLKSARDAPCTVRTWTSAIRCRPDQLAGVRADPQRVRPTGSGLPVRRARRS